METAGDPLFFEKPPQDLLGHLFGQPSRFPGGAHAGRTAFLADADIDRLQAVPEEVFLQVEQSGAQPDAAGIVVVDEDVGLEVGLDEDRSICMQALPLILDFGQA